MRTIISAIGAHIPRTVINSQDLLSSLNLEHHIGLPVTWMDEVMGITERRAAAPGEKPSDLAIDATLECFAKTEAVTPADIDVAIFCGIERDNVEPATAHRVCDQLGIDPVFAFDISNACHGFVDGLVTADSLIKAGVAKHVLVCTGEIQHNQASYFADQIRKAKTKAEAFKVVGYLTLGDAGGAAIVSAVPDTNQAGFTGFNAIVKSKYRKYCHYNLLPDGSYEGEMNMPRIVTHGIRMHKDLLSETDEKLMPKKPDWVITHQTGRRNLQKVADENYVPMERIVSTFEKLGNITSATFPVAFKKLLDENPTKPTDLVGCFFAGSGMVVSQFGYVL